MYRIAWNLLREHWRTQRRYHAFSHVPLDLIEPLLGDAASVEDIVDARRALHRLSSQTLDALPSKCRKAFVLHRVDGLTYPEIAAAMGISVKMVEKHIGRALARCRAALGRPR
ncbi:RNA polymerase sigma factor [Luteimonas sp. XNQY3]|nr:RNA polymerase sigma factor [Luteimonas sp. XNQY3]